MSDRTKFNNSAGLLVKEKITILIEKIDSGYFVDSQDLKQLNLFVKMEIDLINAIPEAIKYLFKHNRGVDVRVLMEVPVFPVDSPNSERIIELENLSKAA